MKQIEKNPETNRDLGKDLHLAEDEKKKSELSGMKAKLMPMDYIPGLYAWASLFGPKSGTQLATKGDGRGFTREDGGPRLNAVAYELFEQMSKMGGSWMQGDWKEAMQNGTLALTDEQMALVKSLFAIGIVQGIGKMQAAFEKLRDTEGNPHTPYEALGMIWSGVVDGKLDREDKQNYSEFATKDMGLKSDDSKQYWSNVFKLATRGLPFAGLIEYPRKTTEPQQQTDQPKPVVEVQPKEDVIVSPPGKETVEKKVEPIVGKMPGPGEILSSLAQTQPPGLQYIPKKEGSRRFERKMEQVAEVKEEIKPVKKEEPVQQKKPPEIKQKTMPVKIDMRESQGLFGSVDIKSGRELPDYRKESEMMLGSFGKRTQKVKEKKKEQVAEVKEGAKPVMREEPVVKIEKPLVKEEKKTPPKESKAKESIFTKYPEFGGQERKTGIDWVDALWADPAFVEMYGEISSKPEERKQAVYRFIERASEMKKLYESMASGDAEKDRNRLVKVLKSNIEQNTR